MTTRQWLRDRATARSHRTQFTEAQIDHFIDDAITILQERFSRSFELGKEPGDTNPELQFHPMMFHYLVMRLIKEHGEDYDGAAYYDQIFAQTADRMNIENMEFGNWSNPTMYVQSEEERAAALEGN